MKENLRKKDSDPCVPPKCGGYQNAIREAATALSRTPSRATIDVRAPSNIGQLKSLLDDLKGKLDGMNEMSEMTSLRLQMTMDRRSKFIETLSQMMKKISTTQDISVQNLK